MNRLVCLKGVAARQRVSSVLLGTSVTATAKARTRAFSSLLVLRPHQPVLAVVAASVDTAQQRWLSNKKKKNNNSKYQPGGSADRSGGGGGGDSIKLKCCWTSYDLEDDSVDSDYEDMHAKAKFDLKDIREKVEEAFGSSKELEYYDDGAEEWKPLKDLNALQKFKGMKQALPVRVPSMYDEGANEEEYDPDEEEYGNDDEEDLYGGGEGTRKNKMESNIRELVVILKDTGYVRSDGKQFTLKSTADNSEISTKEWVLSQVQDSDSLESLLLGNVGALDHIVQCLHYDMVWKNEDADDKPEE